MKRSLSPREKRLLLLCLGALFVAVNLLALREFTLRRVAAASGLQELVEQQVSNRAWLNDRDFWNKRMNWLDETMPRTNSAGKSQGELLEEIQNTALDHELKISNQTLLEALALDHYNEVAVNVRVRGDQDKMLRWLLTLQSPEKFQAIKSLELELDSRAREKTPQAQCNLIIARWFNTMPSGGGTAPAPVPVPMQAPEPAPEYEPDIVNPLDTSLPFEQSPS